MAAYVVQDDLTILCDSLATPRAAVLALPAETIRAKGHVIVDQQMEALRAKGHTVDDQRWVPIPGGECCMACGVRRVDSASEEASVAPEYYQPEGLYRAQCDSCGRWTRSHLLMVPQPIENSDADVILLCPICTGEATVMELDLR